MIDNTTGQAVINNASVPGNSYASTTHLTPGHSFTWYIGADSATSAALAFSSPQSFSLAALAAPTPVTPSSRTIPESFDFDTPAFLWNSIPGANHYYLYVVDNTTGLAAVNNPNVSGTSFTPSTAQALTPGHSFTWYIGAVSTNSAGVSFSGPTGFSLAPMTAPTPVSPIGTTIAPSTGFDTPTFSWNSISGVDHYYLYVLDNTTNKTVVNNSTVPGNTYTPSTPLTPGHSFTWYIGATSTNGGATGWSGPQGFSLAALAEPTLTGPSGTIASSGMTTFSWNAVASANHYYLYVLDNTSNQAVNKPSVSGTSDAEALTTGHSYTWYLAAASTNGAALSWSYQTFTVLASPTLAAPTQIGPSGTIAAGLNFDTPTFRWGTAAGAAHYYLFVLDNTTNVAAVNLPSLSVTSFTPATALTPGHNFTWYIGAASTSGAIAWTWETFALAALTAPTPLSLSGTVSAGVVSTTPTFSWSSVSGAAHYFLYLIDNAGGAALINNSLVTGTTYTSTPTLKVGHSYTWYVAAESTNNVDLLWSGPDSFTLNP